MQELKVGTVKGGNLLTVEEEGRNCLKNTPSIDILVFSSPSENQ